MSDFLHDALYTAGGVLLARWLLDGYCARLDADVAKAEAILREADAVRPVRRSDAREPWNLCLRRS